jgi:hypothetical protein
MVARIGNCRIQSRPDRLLRLVKTMRKEVAARGPTIDLHRSNPYPMINS